LHVLHQFDFCMTVGKRTSIVCLFVFFFGFFILTDFVPVFLVKLDQFKFTSLCPPGGAAGPDFESTADGAESGERPTPGHGQTAAGKQEGLRCP
jgi:hypothetical protein